MIGNEQRVKKELLRTSRRYYFLQVQMEGHSQSGYSNTRPAIGICTRLVMITPASPTRRAQC